MAARRNPRLRPVSELDVLPVQDRALQYAIALEAALRSLPFPESYTLREPTKSVSLPILIEAHRNILPRASAVRGIAWVRNDLAHGGGVSHEEDWHYASKEFREALLGVLDYCDETIRRQFLRDATIGPPGANNAETRTGGRGRTKTADHSSGFGSQVDASRHDILAVQPLQAIQAAGECYGTRPIAVETVSHEDYSKQVSSATPDKQFRQNSKSSKGTPEHEPAAPSFQPSLDVPITSDAVTERANRNPAWIESSEMKGLDERQRLARRSTSETTREKKDGANPWVRGLRTYRKGSISGVTTWRCPNCGETLSEDDGSGSLEGFIAYPVASRETEVGDIILCLQCGAEFTVAAYDYTTPKGLLDANGYIKTDHVQPDVILLYYEKPT